ncbi:hypothetical protein E4N62_01490 [Streptomyces sp. MNU76]|nr:hypothetical protein [Streptomyces sp. MNU76]MCC9704051.1 hypothetical protein [Streptomyces sp. MNU76]
MNSSDCSPLSLQASMTEDRLRVVTPAYSSRRETLMASRWDRLRITARAGGPPVRPATTSARSSISNGRAVSPSARSAPRSSFSSGRSIVTESRT